MFSIKPAMKKCISFAAATTVLSLLTAGCIMLTQPAVSHAATECVPQDLHPETNLIYCGIRGSNVAAMIKDFQTYYNQNSDKAPDNTSHVRSGDLQAVYNYSGGSASLVNSMNT